MQTHMLALKFPQSSASAFQGLELWPYHVLAMFCSSLLCEPAMGSAASPSHCSGTGHQLTLKIGPAALLCHLQPNPAWHVRWLMKGP